MNNKYIAKHSKYVRIPVMALMIVILCTSLSFAAGKTTKTTAAKSTAKTAKTAKINYHVFSHTLTKEDIKKYGTYKGKNATRIPVITYHQILTDENKKSDKYKSSTLTISESTFKQQMRYLHSKHYRTINCDEFYLWYTGKIKLPKRTVLITFDDGYKSAAGKAIPVLKKYKMKGTFFVVGNLVHGGGTARFFSEKSMLQAHMKNPDIEFQSHTYNLHYVGAIDSGYESFYNDAITMDRLYGFNYLAYPYGASNDIMISAFKNKKTGLRMAFSFGDSGYATRKQKAFCIKRIAILDQTSLSEFKSWCK